MRSYIEQFCKKQKNFRGLGEPLKFNIFQKYFTHSVFRVDGTLWQGKTSNFTKKLLFEPP